MSSEILINVTPSETRAVVVDNGVLQEVFIERTEYRGLVGNIYKGKVCRVLPGMQAAFVEIGLARAAFLHASDISIPQGQTGDLQETEVPPITSLLREGQEVLVQVIKDPMGTKGARLTTQLSVSSRYLVYMPETQGIGVSLKIEGEEERDRLKACLVSQLDLDTGGYILRTAAEGVQEGELLADLQFLHRLWAKLMDRKTSVKQGETLHEDLPLALRSLRDLFSPDVEKIRIDSTETFAKAVKFAEFFSRRDVCERACGPSCWRQKVGRGPPSAALAPGPPGGGPTSYRHSRGSPGERRPWPRVVRNRHAKADSGQTARAGCFRRR